MNVCGRENELHCRHSIVITAVVKDSSIEWTTTSHDDGEQKQHRTHHHIRSVKWTIHGRHHQHPGARTRRHSSQPDIRSLHAAHKPQQVSRLLERQELLAAKRINTGQVLGLDDKGFLTGRTYISIPFTIFFWQTSVINNKKEKNNFVLNIYSRAVLEPSCVR